MRWSERVSNLLHPLTYYQTQKVVVINDTRLGLMYLGGLFAVFLYFVIGLVIVDRSYLTGENTVGEAFLSLSAPSEIYFSNYSYCENSPRPATPEAPKYPCHFWGASDTRYPALEPGSAFISTHVTITNQTRECGAFNTIDSPTVENNCSSPFRNVGPSQSAFLAGVEDFTLEVNHYIKPILKVGRRIDADEFKLLHHFVGELVDDAGNVMKTYSGDRTIDTMTLKELYIAGGGDVNDFKYSKNSQLINGMLAVVTINYENYDAIDTIKYSYRVTLHRPKYQVEEVRWKSFNERTVLSRTGIKIYAYVGGTIYEYSFATLAIAFSAALGLLRVVTILVDLVMLYLLPQRRYYDRLKNEDPDNALLRPLTRADGTVHKGSCDDGGDDNDNSNSGSSKNASRDYDDSHAYKHMQEEGDHSNTANRTGDLALDILVSRNASNNKSPCSPTSIDINQKGVGYVSPKLTLADTNTTTSGLHITKSNSNTSTNNNNTSSTSTCDSRGSLSSRRSSSTTSISSTTSTSTNNTTSNSSTVPVTRRDSKLGGMSQPLLPYGTLVPPRTPSPPASLATQRVSASASSTLSSSSSPSVPPSSSSK